VRELIRRYQIFAAAIVAVVAAIIAYPAWVINEALADFMSPPRSTANVGLLFLIYVPLVLIGAIVCWKVSKTGVDFLWQVGVASTLAILVMAVVHQSAVSRKWEQTPQGRQQHETEGVSAAYERLLQPGALATLKPPLDQYEVEALRMRVFDQRLDSGTLHHIFVTFPKQADCEIVKNPNARTEDLVAIWNKHACPDDYSFVMNPNVPVEIVRSIYDSLHDKTLDEHGEMVHNEAMLRLAKGSCDPELLYSFFKAREPFPPDHKVGAALRINLLRNMCLPDVACQKLQNPSDVGHAVCNEHERGVARWDPKVREAEAWKPVR
jgi:hypothetical protein